MAPGLGSAEVLPFPKSHRYMALAEVPKLWLEKETDNGEQPPDLSIEKFAVSCAWLNAGKAASKKKTKAVRPLKKAIRWLIL